MLDDLEEAVQPGGDDGRQGGVEAVRVEPGGGRVEHGGEEGVEGDQGQQRQKEDRAVAAAAVAGGGGRGSGCSFASSASCSCRGRQVRRVPPLGPVDERAVEHEEPERGREHAHRSQERQSLGAAGGDDQGVFEVLQDGEVEARAEEDRSEGDGFRPGRGRDGLGGRLLRLLLLRRRTAAAANAAANAAAAPAAPAWNDGKAVRPPPLLLPAGEVMVVRPGPSRRDLEG